MSSGASPRRGLGRGLEVLIGGAETGPTQLAELPVDAIHANPRQPRRRFEPEATSGLASSIKQQGLLQPIVVRPRQAGGYELIAGERRWRAAREAGLETLPALVRDADDRDSLLLALVENVAREQLSPVEEARAYASLVDEFELSLGEVADRVGRSKPSVSNRLRLLELPEEVLWMVARGELTEGHAARCSRCPTTMRARDSRSGSSATGCRCGPRRRPRRTEAPPASRGRRPRSIPRLQSGLAGLPSGSPASRAGQCRQARDPLRRGAPARRARRGARELVARIARSAGRLAQLVRAPL